ncbi:hypothetical protein [Streptodolium elevatio]
MHSRTAVTTAIAVALTAVLTSCSSSSNDDADSNSQASSASRAELDAQQIALAALDAVTNAPTYRITTDGTDENGTPTKADLCFTRAGDFTGTFTLGDHTSDIVATGAEIFWRAPGAMYSSLADNAGDGALDQARVDLIDRALADRYVRYAGPEARNAPFTGIRDLVDLVEPAHTGELTKGAPTALGGRSVIPLRMDYDGGAATTLYIPVDGDPFPTRIEETPGTAGGPTLTTAFTSPAEPCTPTAPQPDRYLDSLNLEAAFKQAAHGA